MSYTNCFDKIIKNEGGYVNDPDDNGGETYKGISRKFHPNWEGWPIVDKFKTTFPSTFKSQLNHSVELEPLVKSFYRKYFWDAIRLDEVKNKKLQFQMFDDAVNRGVKAAIYSAQHLMGMTLTGKMSDELIYNLNHYGKV